MAEPLLELPDQSTAEFVVGILAEHDIPARLDNSLAPAFGLPTGVSLSVADTDRARAQAVLCQENIVCRIEARLAATVADNFARSLDGAGGDGDFRGAIALLEHLPVNWAEEVLARCLEARPNLDQAYRLFRAACRQGEPRPLHQQLLQAMIRAGANREDLFSTLERDPAWADDGARRNLAGALEAVPLPAAARFLVGLLADPAPAVRDQALESLYFLTDGETFGFEPERDPGEQAAVLRRWAKWAEELVL